MTVDCISRFSGPVRLSTRYTTADIHCRNSYGKNKLYNNQLANHGDQFIQYINSHACNLAKNESRLQYDTKLLSRFKHQCVVRLCNCQCCLYEDTNMNIQTFLATSATTAAFTEIEPTVVYLVRFLKGSTTCKQTTPSEVNVVVFERSFSILKHQDTLAILLIMLLTQTFFCVQLCI